MVWHRLWSCSTRFLMRVGQTKILISSHFVHTETQTDMQTKMDALQRPRLLISSTGDCPMLVKMRVRLPLFPHIHIYLLADRETENDRERCSDAEGLMVSLQSRMPPSSPDSLSAPLSLSTATAVISGNQGERRWNKEVLKGT